MEITLNAKEAMLAKVRRALSNKDKLVGQKGTDGRNKYQMEIQKIKDQVKGFKGLSFRDLLKEVKTQEKEGKFDRGAEGKAKKAMRKKMLDKRDGSKRGGVHKGTRADKENELTQRVMDDPEYKAMKKKNKTKTGPGSR
jgi:hypothetical protein|tara:strand:- start:56 stop:472 length:417 start_codon:yes stop_codon:yes gene_type:complete